MFDVAGCQHHGIRHGNGGNLRIVYRNPPRDWIFRKDPCCRQIEWQHPTFKGWQDLGCEPAAQHLALGWIHRLFATDSALDLSDRKRGHELVLVQNSPCPCGDLRIAMWQPQCGYHIGVQNVSHNSTSLLTAPKRSGSNSTSSDSGMASRSTREIGS